MAREVKDETTAHLLGHRPVEEHQTPIKKLEQLRVESDIVNANEGTIPKDVDVFPHQNLPVLVGSVQFSNMVVVHILMNGISI